MAINTTSDFDTSTLSGQYFATHQQQGDAWAQLAAVLTQYGLSDLGDLAKNAIINGLSYNQAYEQITETPTYKIRFAGNVARVNAGLTPLSEDEYLANEDQYRKAMKAANLPSGFYDTPDDFANLIAGDVSPTELQSRISDGYLKMQNADPATKLAAQQYFGLNDGDLAAYYIDPKKALSVLQNQTIQAQIGGNAAKSGFGSLSLADAQRLQGEGVTGDNSLDQFGDLAQKKELFSGLPGQNEDNISTDAQLGAEFDKNANDITLVKNRATQRTAATQQGGGFVTDKNGFSGIGAKK